MILIAVGANLSGPHGEVPLVTCKAAVHAMADLPGLDLIAASKWYLTDPVPPSGQPSFVNGAVRLAGRADPAWLLRRLLAIEALAGRTRGEANGEANGGANAARVLDLDLIAMGQTVRSAPDPVLPHPRAHLRGFVLAPLAEIAPEWVHPHFGLTAGEMLGGLPETGRTLL